MWDLLKLNTAFVFFNLFIMIASFNVGFSFRRTFIHGSHHQIPLNSLTRLRSSNSAEILKSVQVPKVVFILGGPGAGKGTQCEKLAQEFGMLHLSAGDLLRKERESGSTDGQLIEDLIKDGKIVPALITVNLLKKAMQKSNHNRFLIDGFPRNWDNLETWDSIMTSNDCEVEVCLFIDCPEQELEKRLLIRGETSGRSDDNLETARKRFATFRAATLPIVEHFEEKNLLVRVAGIVCK